MEGFVGFRYSVQPMPVSLLPSMYKNVSVEPAPKWWKHPCSHEECTLHQLAPYIGKIKSKIAADLIERYTKPGDLVVDPFAGSGTIPLEATIRGRRVFAADISAYAKVISTAKLSPPDSLEDALKKAENILLESQTLARPDLRAVPHWIRKFFHPRTLCDVIRFSALARRPGNEFLMACFLGILHHQRPGFLSYPSSHLVPYLRDKKYPRQCYPEMYAYRELRSRLLSKIARSYKRFAKPMQDSVEFSQQAVEHLELPARVDALITSPPYMNALDYGRDNRLRLWFIDPDLARPVDTDIATRRRAFENGITSLTMKLRKLLKPKGFCVLIVGEEVHRTFSAHPSDVVISKFAQNAPAIKLKTIIADDIPDVRRTRRECRGVKTEHFLIFQKT